MLIRIRNEKVFEILESKIPSKNHQKGRLELDLSNIFILSKVRLCQNISYDDNMMLVFWTKE